MHELLTKTFGGRAIAALGAVALGMGAALGLSSPASADPATFGNIDGGKTGSLTVHKYLYQDGDTQGDISAAPVDGDFADPVADVVFTVYPLLVGGSPVDLMNPESWNGLETLTPGADCTAPAGYTLGAGTAMPATTAAGVSTLALPVGLYQVCETSAPVNIVSKAPAFILTVPMPHEQGWVYDVHAYPKNGESSLEKSIDAQEGLGLGAPVRFPVTNVIPDMGPNTWTGYAIRDTLDSRLTPTGDGVLSVTLDGAPLDSTFYTATVSGQVVTMDFTAAGISWLNEGPNGQAGKTIVVTFDSTVTSVGNGAITNQADLFTNNPDFVGDGIPSDEVTTNWGNLLASKVAAGANGATLEGAVFEVYAAQDPYAADCSAAVATGDPIAVNGATTFTSTAAGVVTIDGLFVSDSVNPVIDAAQRCYVLKETVAPAGYVLPENAFTPVAVKTGQTDGVGITIVNTQQKMPGLPMTGAAGQLLLIVAGLGVGSIVVGLMLVNRRRSAAAQG